MVGRSLQWISYIFNCIKGNFSFDDIHSTLVSTNWIIIEVKRNKDQITFSIQCKLVQQTKYVYLNIKILYS